MIYFKFFCCNFSNKKFPIFRINETLQLQNLKMTAKIIYINKIQTNFDNEAWFFKILTDFLDNSEIILNGTIPKNATIYVLRNIKELNFKLLFLSSPAAKEILGTKNTTIQKTTTAEALTIGQQTSMTEFTDITSRQYTLNDSYYLNATQVQTNVSIEGLVKITSPISHDSRNLNGQNLTSIEIEVYFDKINN